MSYQSPSTKPSPRIPANAWGLVLRVIIAVAVLLGANIIRVPFLHG